MATKKKSPAKKSKTVTRSASTGKFVRTTTVERHPSTTVTETVRKPKKKPTGS